MFRQKIVYEECHLCWMQFFILFLYYITPIPDSVNLSGMAISAAAKYIEHAYGSDYLTVRKYATKNKNAQEAHEAIRPTYIDRIPQASGLSGQELKLYELIWSRTVASQMASAKVLNTTYTFNPE